LLFLFFYKAKILKFGFFLLILHGRGNFGGLGVVGGSEEVVAVEPHRGPDELHVGGHLLHIAGKECVLGITRALVIVLGVGPPQPFGTTP
jgi:hypothetical protein